ncbi:MAG: response regulator [Bacteriovoracaceae bacterium]|nr:response regulator [Bacteriovoracaceae bacterium]
MNMVGASVEDSTSFMPINSKNKTNVLIVDDDEAILDWFSCLGEGPWNFSHLDDEMKLLDTLSFNVPDLIIMDVNLKNFDGRKLGNVLRALYDYRMPILYMSSDKNAQIKHGIEEKFFLEKPFKKEIVLKKLCDIT